MATSDIAMERVQALLKVDTGDGSLYSHVVKIASAMSQQKPNDALDIIESLSHNLKKANFRGTGAPDPEQDIIVDADADEKRRQWCENALTLVRQPSDPLSSSKVLGAVQNYMEDATMFEWAGVGFGRQENFHIAMSLRKLAADVDGLGKLRLWGKVLGTQGDYYVAEGTIQVPDTRGEGAPPPPVLPGSPEYDVEGRGEGANTNTYWVSSGGAAPWVRLPVARASNIVAARKFKHLMTGQLGSPVNTMPFFPGRENHYLRAQIARITSTCTLAVSGYYEVDDAEDAKKNAIRVANEGAPEFPGHETLAGLDGWVHAAPALLSTGKSSWPNFDNLEEGTLSEEVLNAINVQRDNEPEKGMLEAIGTDLVAELGVEDAGEGSPAWNIKGQYTFPDATKSYRITAVRSMIWPGAIAVAQGSRFANLYVGYAQKCATLVDPYKESGLPLAGASAFSSGNMQLPLAPEDVMDEPNYQEEQEEPQPPLADDASDGDDMEPPDDA